MSCHCNGKCPNIAAPLKLAREGQGAKAQTILRQSLVGYPLCVEGNFLLANMLERTNHGAAALVHVERAAQKLGDTARVQLERGKALRTAMRLEDAATAFYAAMQADPENPIAASALVGALEMAGNLEGARQVCEAARVRFPDFIDLRRLEAVIADAEGDTERAAAILGAVSPLPPPEKLELGRFLDKLGRHGEAWALWMEAKAELRDKAGHVYNAEFFDRQFAGLREAGTAPRPNFVRSAPALKSDPAPIFICGFPRSGTTMLESMLTGHSAIMAGDEMPGIPDVVEVLPAWCKVRVPYPAALIATSLGENALVPELLREFYMRAAQERIGFERRPIAGKGPRKPQFFTDKMPLNELHLPLVRMLFPAAPILRLERHPLDVMVSCMSYWLVQGGFYASSLEACARHFLAVDSLVQHYRAQFRKMDRPSLDSVRYADLVSDPKTTLAQIVGGMGLKLEKSCLDFHSNPRQARTHSYRQVKKPLNRAGVDRWKNYREQLSPAVEILKPILERDGYEH